MNFRLSVLPWLPTAPFVTSRRQTSSSKNEQSVFHTQIFRLIPLLIASFKRVKSSFCLFHKWNPKPPTPTVFTLLSGEKYRRKFCFNSTRIVLEIMRFKRFFRCAPYSRSGVIDLGGGGRITEEQKWREVILIIYNWKWLELRSLCLYGSRSVKLPIKKGRLYKSHVENITLLDYLVFSLTHRGGCLF